MHEKRQSQEAGQGNQVLSCESAVRKGAVFGRHFSPVAKGSDIKTNLHPLKITFYSPAASKDHAVPRMHFDLNLCSEPLWPNHQLSSNSAAATGNRTWW